MEQTIKRFYADLVKTLPMDDAYFRSLLFSADLLPGNLKDEVKSMTTRADKAEYFLDHGIKGDTTKFLNLLEVLKKSEDNSVIKLTEQIINDIDQVTTYSETTGFCFMTLLHAYICTYLCISLCFKS